MIEQPFIVVEAEQQRTDDPLLFGVAEPAGDAVGGTLLLDLDHRPLARAVALVGALVDYAVEGAAAAFQPADGLGSVAGHGRQLTAGRLVRAEAYFELLA